MLSSQLRSCPDHLHVGALPQAQTHSPDSDTDETRLTSRPLLSQMLGTNATWIVNVSIALAILASYVMLGFAARATNARGPATIVLVTGGSVLIGTALWLVHSFVAPFVGWHAPLNGVVASQVSPFALGVMEALYGAER